LIVINFSNNVSADRSECTCIHRCGRWELHILGEDVHAKQQKGGEYIVAERSLPSWPPHLSKI